jgi:thiol-disulfide isomerase/thioredoxin
MDRVTLAKGWLILAAMVFAAGPLCAQTSPRSIPLDAAREYWNLDISMLDGTTLTADETRGKILVIDVWGTWCGPCHKVIPKLIEIQARFAGRGIDVIGISAEVSGDYETAVRRVRKYADKVGINYRLGILDQKVYERIRAIMRFQNDDFTVPSTFIIDRTGLIIARYPGYFVGQEDEIAALLTQQLEAEASIAAEAP